MTLFFYYGLKQVQDLQWFYVNDTISTENVCVCPLLSPEQDVLGEYNVMNTSTKCSKSLVLITSTSIHIFSWVQIQNILRLKECDYYCEDKSIPRGTSTGKCTNTWVQYKCIVSVLSMSTWLFAWVWVQMFALAAMFILLKYVSMSANPSQGTSTGNCFNTWLDTKSKSARNYSCGMVHSSYTHPQATSSSYHHWVLVRPARVSL